MNQRLRCAIYTRKSTDEGLDQAFNSLDAQREACEAYVKSQQQEGWQAIASRYDDGNYSGGNLERPALKQIMADIEAGKVNVVVVYKVDRLTRSLTDFAKIIELFDEYKVSFVSVTQHFNTTSSMGRLTLNVLLSFAQFEREVTGERIRDKIAASKKKGMWMGGNVPLGYKVVDRKLLVEDSEAVTVRRVFHEFLRLGSVLRLEEWLRANDIKTRRGYHFLRGPLYTMLRNPLYLGLIRHKTEIYSGEHEGIIDRVTWDKAQSILNNNVRGRRRMERSTQPSLQWLDLGERIWRVDLNPHTGPVLQATTKVPELPTKLKNDPLLQGVIYPQAFREVLWFLVREEEIDDDLPWVQNWRDFISKLTGVNLDEETPEDDEEREQIVEDAVKAFSGQHNFASRAKQFEEVVA